MTTETAANLADKSQEKRAVVFLICVGNEAYNVYRVMDFENADDRKKLDPVIAAFEKCCIGAVTVKYERYVFNRRVSEGANVSKIYRHRRIDDPGQDCRRNSK